MLKYGRFLTCNIKLQNFLSTYATQIKPVELAYDLYGSGTSLPLIILHSLCSNKSAWRPICKDLQNKLIPSRKIYAIDARNHGSSEYSNEHTYECIAEDIVHFLTEHNINKAVVMGHSMGGRAMMFLAMKYPKLVDRAIILDVSPLEKPPSSEILYANIVLSMMKNTPLPATLTIGESRAIAGDRIRQLIPKEFEINYLLQNLIKNEDENFTWSLNIDALQNYLKTICVFPQYILERSKFTSPVLFIGGTNSNYINTDQWPEIIKWFPNSTLSWVNAGHLVHIEQPQKVVDLVSKFLNCTQS